MEEFDLSALPSGDLLHRHSLLRLRLVEIEFSTETPQEINENGLNSKTCIELMREIENVLKTK